MIIKYIYRKSGQPIEGWYHPCLFCYSYTSQYVIINNVENSLRFSRFRKPKISYNMSEISSNSLDKISCSSSGESSGESSGDTIFSYLQKNNSTKKLNNIKISKKKSGTNNSGTNNSGTNNSGTNNSGTNNSGTNNSDTNNSNIKNVDKTITGRSVLTNSCFSSCKNTKYNIYDFNKSKELTVSVYSSSNSDTYYMSRDTQNLPSTSDSTFSLDFADSNDFYCSISNINDITSFTDCSNINDNNKYHSNNIEYRTYICNSCKKEIKSDLTIERSFEKNITNFILKYKA